MDERFLDRFSRISWSDIEKNLTSKTPFEAISPSAAALIRVRSFDPLIGVAPHAGQRVREELLAKMEIDESSRQYEEDFGIEKLLEGFPVQLIALDSRYEYDVNRSKNDAIYLKPHQSWGKRVWNTPPNKDEVEVSMMKYEEFHEILSLLVSSIKNKSGKNVVLDTHSYNYDRPKFRETHRKLPDINLGTVRLDRKRFEKILSEASRVFGEISIPGHSKLILAENDVFLGDGEIATSIASSFPETLVISVEFKKIYLDAASGEVLPEVLQSLNEQYLKLARQVLDRYLNNR